MTQDMSSLNKIIRQLAAIAGLSALSATVALPAEEVYVVGLFQDRAVVMIDGKRRLLSVGGDARSGVLLISASSESAVLEIDGVRGIYEAESRIHEPARKRVVSEATIWRDGTGLYQTVGSINGQLFSLLIDTGATQIAISSIHAKRLGIDYEIVGSPVRVSTASGEEQVYRINLKSVRIGDVQLNDVGALVLPGNYPDKVLLGMSFLKRVEMQNEGRRLTLRKKY